MTPTDADVIAVFKDYVWVPLITIIGIAAPLLWNMAQERKKSDAFIRQQEAKRMQQIINQLRKDVVKLEDDVSDFASTGVTAKEVKEIVAERLEFVVASLREVSRMMDASHNTQIKLRESYARQDERLSMTEREIERIKDGR